MWIAYDGHLSPRPLPERRKHARGAVELDAGLDVAIERHVLVLCVDGARVILAVGPRVGSNYEPPAPDPDGGRVVIPPLIRAEGSRGPAAQVQLRAGEFVGPIEGVPGWRRGAGRADWRVGPKAAKTCEE